MSSSPTDRAPGSLLVLSYACGFLAVFGGLAAGVRAHLFGPVPGWAVVVCTAPVLLPMLLALPVLGKINDLSTRATACVLVTPLLLIAWVGESEPASPPSTPAAVLDLARVFRDAALVNDFPEALPGVALLRSAAFTDGSTLLIRRFVDASSAAQAATQMADTLSAEPVHWRADRTGRLAHGADSYFTYIESHGRDVLQVQAPSEPAILARLDAQGVPAPSPTLLVSPAPRVWPWVVGLCVIHVLGFVAFIYRVGSISTRVAALAGRPTTSVSELARRIVRLPDAGLPCTVERVDDTTLLVDFIAPEGVARSLRVSLRIVEGARIVRVRELAGAHGDAPRDADEASLRAPGERDLDASRPDADAIYTRSLQTRFIDAERLALWAPSTAQDTLRFPNAPAQPYGEGSLVHALCALIIDAGFTWQPVFRLGRAARSRHVG